MVRFAHHDCALMILKAYEHVKMNKLVDLALLQCQNESDTSDIRQPELDKSKNAVAKSRSETLEQLGDLDGV
jgi:hypothetical protein